MKWSTTALLTTMSMGLWALPAAGQDLAAAAAKEKERRKGKSAGKFITEADLKTPQFPVDAGASEGEGESASPAASASPQPAGAAKPLTPDEERAKKEQDWRKRRDATDKEVTALTGLLGEIQAVLNDNTTSQYGAARQRAITDLQDTQGKLDAARQKLEAIEDEGRRNRYR